MLARLIIFFTFSVLILGLIFTTLRVGRGNLDLQKFKPGLSNENSTKILSIKQIDSLTAATNIRFVKTQD